MDIYSPHRSTSQYKTKIFPQWYKKRGMHFPHTDASENISPSIFPKN
ncbi:hypothetical protein LEQ41_04890 [Streptococcus agalactiae]|nr:hypothetical protein [Streptococcus agalactiae]